MRDFLLMLIGMVMLVFITITMILSLDESLRHEELKQEQYQKHIYLNKG